MKIQEFYFILDKDFILNHFNCRMKDINNLRSLGMVMQGKTEVNEKTGIPCYYGNKAKYNEFFAPMTLKFLEDLFTHIVKDKLKTKTSDELDFSDIEQRIISDFFNIREEICRTDSFIANDHPDDFYDSYIFNCVSPVFRCIDGKFIKFFGDVM
jgi:hypothetical protein